MYSLVADEELVDALGGVAVNLLEPLLDVGERVLVGDVVHDNDAVRASVVRRRDRAEALLPCRVPLFKPTYKSAICFVEKGKRSERFVA